MNRVGGKKVSIVLPTYNGERYLAAAIQSCMGQTYEDIELIIVDDCSNDSTTAICHKQRDPRINYVRNPVNRGLPASLNHGFSLATGEYLTWTSDDNEYLPSAIARLVDTLERSPAVDFVYSDLWLLDTETGQREEKRLADTPELERHNGVMACFLYTRRVLERIGGYDARFALVEDYDYWIRIAKQFPVRHCRETLYVYRYHPRSLTSMRKGEVWCMNAALLAHHGFHDSRWLRGEFRSVLGSLWLDFPLRRSLAATHGCARRLGQLPGRVHWLFLATGLTVAPRIAVQSLRRWVLRSRTWNHARWYVRQARTILARQAKRGARARTKGRRL